MIILLVIAGLLGFIIMSGIAKAKARMHYANSQQAHRELEMAHQTSDYQYPTWIDNAASVDAFTDCVTKLVDRRKISLTYLGMMMAHAEFPLMLMTFVSSLEKAGSSFPEQQVGAADFIQRAWDRLPAPDKAKALAFDASGVKIDFASLIREP